MMNRNKLSTIHYGDGLSSRPVILGSLCMDYPPHHLVSSHRNLVVEAPLNGLETVDTMRVNRVNDVRNPYTLSS